MNKRTTFSMFAKSSFMYLFCKTKIKIKTWTLAIALHCCLHESDSLSAALYNLGSGD